MTIPNLNYQYCKKACRVATDGTSIDLTSTSDPGSIDGVTLADGDRVLLKNQNTGSENGLYNAVTAADPSTWKRTFDADTDDLVKGGMVVPISEGSSNGNALFQLQTDDPITVGTTSLSFAEAGGSGSSGGGYTKTETTTQTGDTQTQINSISVPDNAVSWLEIYLGVWADDGSSVYSASFWRLYKQSKSSGTIQSLSLAQNSSGDEQNYFSNEQRNLFANTDLVVSKNSGNISIDVKSPDTENFDPPQKVDSFDTAPSDDGSNASRCAIATDPNNGDIYYVYTNDASDSFRLRLPDGTTEEITIDVPDSSQPANTDLHVDVNGELHVVWTSASSTDLLYSKRSGGTWSANEVITSNGGRGCSLDVDENQVPYVSYLEIGNIDIRLSNRSGGSWSEEIVDSSGSATRLHVDTSSNIGIFYNTASDVLIALGSPGSFSTETVETGSVNDEPKDLDYNNADSKWFLTWVGGDNNKLWAAYGSSGSFTPTEVDQFTNQLSSSDEQESILARSRFFNAILVADPDNSGDVRYYKDKSGSWSFDSTLESFGDTRWVSHKTDSYWSIAVRRSKAQNFQLQKTVSASIDWNLGTQIKNI